MPPSNACLPDWRGIADDWNAVHLSVAGYLTTATRMLPLADPASATVLAGCNPHQMWWLTHTSGSHKVTSSPARFVRILVLDQLIKIMNTCVMEFVDNPDQPRPRRGFQHVGEPGAEWPSVRQHGQHPL